MLSFFLDIFIPLFLLLDISLVTQNTDEYSPMLLFHVKQLLMLAE